MFLKEPGHRELERHGVRVAEVRAVVGGFKQRDVIFVVEVSQAAGHVLAVPFEVAGRAQICSAVLQEAVVAAEIDDGIWVDVGLEFRGIQLCVLLRVHFFRLGFLDLAGLFIDDWRLFLWCLGRDVENSLGSLVADRIAVEHVAPVLAIVLAQPPAERLVEQRSRDLLLVRMALEELVDLSFDFQHREVLRLLRFVELVKFGKAFVFFLEVVPCVNLTLFLFLRLGRRMGLILVV